MSLNLNFILNTDDIFQPDQQKELTLRPSLPVIIVIERFIRSNKECSFPPEWPHLPSTSSLIESVLKHYINAASWLYKYEDNHFGNFMLKPKISCIKVVFICLE
jgi:hypothetical protein